MDQKRQDARIQVKNMNIKDIQIHLGPGAHKIVQSEKVGELTSITFERLE